MDLLVRKIPGCKLNADCARVPISIKIIDTLGDRLTLRERPTGKIGCLQFIRTSRRF